MVVADPRIAHEGAMLYRASIAPWLALSISTASGVWGQTATLVGSVVRDSLGHELPSADVSLPTLGRSTTSNYLGEFRLDGLPPGKQPIVIRHLGFALLQDTIEFVAGRVLQREFVLTPSVAKLDSVVVKAPERRYISGNLRGFEERRASGFGRFISETELRKDDGRPLGNFLMQLPGGMVGRGNHGGEFFLSSRKKCKGEVLRYCNPPNCFVTVYLDGALVYSATSETAVPPDINHLVSVTDLAGVEFYASDSTIPSQFATTNSGCGVLLLWTRER